MTRETSSPNISSPLGSSCWDQVCHGNPINLTAETDRQEEAGLPVESSQAGAQLGGEDIKTFYRFMYI